MPTVGIRNLYGKVIHSIAVDQPRPLFPCDLSGLTILNADLRGADLVDADLRGTVLIGCDLREANLQRAKMCGCDIRYTNLAGADLSGALLENADSYPLNADKKTRFLGARIDAGSELEMLRNEIAEAKRWKDYRPKHFRIPWAVNP
jgi:hypothetical protein